MKVVLTLLVRDEADILDEHLTFHLNAGVAFVVATDHRSQDGTTDILEAYAQSGVLRLLREDEERIRQSEWMTRMARLAAEEHGADWVLSSDADEFWWPRAGSLEEALASVPDGFGTVRGFSQSFVPVRGPGSFAERMTVRLSAVAAINDSATSFRPVSKVAHRAHPRSLVGQGNHAAFVPGRPELPGWHPFELLHFPLRSAEQVARKHRNTLAAWRRNLRGDLARARAISEVGAAEAFYERVALSAEEVERGLAHGLLVEDTRLRDALTAIRGGAPTPFAVPSVRDRARHAAELGSLFDAELVRARRRLDELAQRVAAREAVSARR
ncbi:MAG TPA: glycosyltransferase family 2 protein [Gaiellaceae bacterium]|nr:glycosyltransferase family 2 protein [Gaiellaceae bacterium]